MIRMRKYLLYSQQQITDYKQNYRDFINRKGQAYARWVNSLPFWEWTPLTLPEGQEEAIIGLLCLLHLNGYINMTIKINETCTAIQRNPLTAQEYAEVLKQRGEIHL